MGKKQNGKKNKAKVAEPGESVLEKELGWHGVMKRWSLDRVEEIDRCWQCGSLKIIYSIQKEQNCFLILKPMFKEKLIQKENVDLKWIWCWPTQVEKRHCQGRKRLSRGPSAKERGAPRTAVRSDHLQNRRARGQAEEAGRHVVSSDYNCFSWGGTDLASLSRRRGSITMCACKCVHACMSACMRVPVRYLSFWIASVKSTATF